MKRTLRTLVVGGMAAASLALPVSPAHAAQCVGISYNASGPDEILFWYCETCPQPVHGPIDGRFHVILCADRLS